MCTILIGWHLDASTPLIMAANRDELRARPSDPPLLLNEDPPLYGGRDRLAGGTWLAVDPRGRVCAVTNRFVSGSPIVRDPKRRSRGEIAVDLLTHSPDDADVVAAMETLDPTLYNPVNVLYVSRSTACWISADESGLSRSDIAPGVHVLTVTGLDSADAKSQALLTSVQAVSDDVLAGFEDIARGHASADGTEHGAACIHAPVYGTVSSATVVIARDHVMYRHAEGMPCVTPYLSVDVDL